MTLCGAALALSGAPVHGASSWYAGGLLERGASGYGGVTLALPEDFAGGNWAVRLSGFSSQYTYMSGASRIDGTDTGAQFSGLYQFTGEWGWLNLGGGVRYVNVDLTPNDPGNLRRGGLADAALIADGGWLSGGWRLDGYAEYGVDQRSYFTRAGITHSVTGDNSLRLGIEAGFQGDMYYDRSAVGGLAIVNFENGLEMRLSAGVTMQARRGDQGYVGILFSRAF